MYEPAADDEITGLVRYVDQQLEAIRAAAIGLTDEQVRARPCRSALSIGGLLKHSTNCMRGAITRLTGEVGGQPPLDEAAFAAYRDSFALTADETATGTLADFDAARTEYLAAIAATDPASPAVEGPAPWFGIYDSRPSLARYYLVHQVEELARHAGHADIIREELDGVSVPEIVLTEAGVEGNDFFQPYVGAPGTIGAR
jgi:hypothetical protein